MINSYAYSRVIVTGGAGFIGSHFIEHLLKDTFVQEVIVLDRLNNAGDLHRLPVMDCWAAEKHRVRYVWHDLKAGFSDALLRRIGNVDAIFHFAAGSHVDNSIKDPMSFVMDNVVGTTNLLEAARKILHPEGIFLNFGTDEQFGPSESDEPFTEQSRWRPANPYSASKCGQSSMAHAYYKTFGVPVVQTFCMNVIGARQHVEKFVPKATRAILRGETLPIHCLPLSKTDPMQVEIGRRTWLYAPNVASAVTHLWHIAKPGDYYNIHEPNEFNNLEIAQKIASILGKELKHELVSGESVRPGYDVRYNISGDKLAATGWKPPVGFEEALKQTVLWSAEHKEWLGL